MKFISRDTDYAMRALVFMAHQLGEGKKSIATVEEIVNNSKLPLRFMRRILQKLAKHKVLSSHKGKDGGFSFLRKPRDIHFTDVIKIFQGELDLTNCLLKGDPCPNLKSCALRKRLQKVCKHVDSELKKITVASLLKG